MILHGIISLLTSLSLIVSLFAGVVSTASGIVSAPGVVEAECDVPGIAPPCGGSVSVSDARLPVRYLVRHALVLAQRFSGSDTPSIWRATEGGLSHVRRIPPQFPPVAEHIYLLQAELLI